jgi:hypothetical protein
MGGDRPGKPEEEQQEKELQGHQREAGHDHHADQHEAGAERVADRGSMKAGEEIGHADKADRADDHEDATAKDQRPAENVAEKFEAHGFASSSSSMPSWPRAP